MAMVSARQFWSSLSLTKALRSSSPSMGVEVHKPDAFRAADTKGRAFSSSEESESFVKVKEDVAKEWRLIQVLDCA